MCLLDDVDDTPDLEVDDISKEIETLLHESVKRFSVVDMNTLKKISPATLVHSSPKSVNISSDRSRSHSVNTARKVLCDIKAAGLTYKTPTPEWDKRPFKIRK